MLRDADTYDCYYIPPATAWRSPHTESNFASRHKCRISPSLLPVLLAVNPAFFAVEIRHSLDGSRDSNEESFLVDALDTFCAAEIA